MAGALSERLAPSANGDETETPLSTSDKGVSMWAVRGSNPPHGCDPSGDASQPIAAADPASPVISVYTPVSSESAKSVTERPDAGSVEALATALLNLAPAERARLAAMLLK